MRAARRLLDFRTQKITEKQQLVIAKKEVFFDHIGVDVSGLVGAGLRLSKQVIGEKRRNTEVARHVYMAVHTIIKRFHAKKTLAIFMDGSEMMWKAKKTRTAPVTRKIESRLSRLPAQQIMQVVEEKVIRMMPENRSFPPEVVFSGTCVEGPVEQKMSAWALDIASRDSFRGNDSMCFVGSGELFLNALALTPFYNISTIVQNNNDFKQLTIQDLLEWLSIDDKARAGENDVVSRMRTDIVFLFGLCNGVSATEQPSLAGVNFGDVLNAYFDVAAEGAALFSESGNEHVLDTKVLILVLAKVVKGAEGKRSDPAMKQYLELALQTHTMLCNGYVPDIGYAGNELPSTAVMPQQFLSHLMYQTEKGGRSLRDGLVVASNNTEAVPLTAAEFTLLNFSNHSHMEELIARLVGQSINHDATKRVATIGVEDARAEVRDILKFVPPTKRPKVMHYSPSYCWVQHAKTKLWSFHYIDLGKRQMANETRRRRNEESGVSMATTVSKDGPVSFDAQANRWVNIPQFPIDAAVPVAGKEGGQSTSSSSWTPPKTITVTTWNVMFDRYSGKPTPLGMPGIDWCSPQRYPVLAKGLVETDPDVIGMQEVEPQFWEFLSKQQWVKDNYYFSCNVSGPSINPWGVLMMVHKRNRVVNITHLNIPAFSTHVCLMPVITIQMAHGNVSVAAMHLLAPYTKGHENARTNQDNTLRQRMVKGILGDCITMGDFNDWPESEFTMPENSGYVDAWPMLKPKEYGKTMDESNTFAKLKIEEEFFGRSDKLFLRTNQKKLHPVETHLIGTKSVNTENGDSKAPDYLFPSDHFGVTMKFSSMTLAQYTAAAAADGDKNENDASASKQDEKEEST